MGNFNAEPSAIGRNMQSEVAGMKTADREAAFAKRKKTSLVYLLIGVIAGAVYLLSIWIGNSLFDDVGAFEYSAGESAFQTISGVSLLVAIVSLFAALVRRIIAGIRR